jgi:hypothetical protein
MRIFKIAVALLTTFVAEHAAAQAPLIYIDQGQDWTVATRNDFYSHDQGSRVIPFAWLQALKRPDGQPFLADSLARYGYLPNPANANKLPVGFEVSGPTGAQTVGMTCSACHTRQITVAGQPYRIDGGPAIVDFQSFLSDLDVAVGTVLASDAAFAPFAAAVLAPLLPNPDDVKVLRGTVDAWYLRYHTLMTNALPRPPWGPGRLDAVGMIFNRLTGLDLGQPPSLLIPGNIKPADAPVRYPFLWNATRQDKTQWPGFADNGDDVLGLARNVGEVIGVFAVFQPTKVLGIIPNFLNSTSINFDGLAKIEDLIKKIGPPKWQWPVDDNLAAQGKLIYALPTAQGGCAECHDEKPGSVRLTFSGTWATPSQNVGTDTREYDVLGWQVDPGVLTGTSIPILQQPLKPSDSAFNVLGTSVIGVIGEHFLTLGLGGAAPQAAPPVGGNGLPPELRELGGAFFPAPLPSGGPLGGGVAGAAAPPKGSYESRVLHGIWATAPYLHNGSVPTLTELLKPAADRVKKFKIGPAYDIANVGLAAEQTQFSFELETTDCSNVNSGNSRCGHEFGTQLSPADKKALLEYLKTL